MKTSFSNGLSIEFEAAVLSPLTGEPTHPRPCQLGWFITSVDPDAADLRFRCFHFARVLAPRFRSLYLTSLAEALEAIPDLDAIVVVGQLNAAVVELVGLARRRGLPIFLDLYEDVIAPDARGNEAGLNPLRFLGIAPFLAGITVPTAELADRMESYACYHGLAVSIHVVPDIAETWDTYRATIEAVTGSAPLGELEEPVTKGPLDPRHVLWVGNYGAGHSSSGMFFLKPHLRALRSVSRDIPLELVIVSNNEAIYQVLVEDCGFPTRYVPWSPRSVYSELRKADVALVTEGHDESSAVGSSHRVVQALAAGVPVITSKNASNTEFQDALFLGRTTDALRLCLGPSRDRAVPPLVEAAGPVLDRYTPERLGGIWDKLLTNSITRARIERTKNRSGKVLVFIEPGDMPSAVKSVVAAAKKFPTLDYELITSAEVLEGEPDFGAALHLARTIPRFVSDLADMESYLLAGCSAAVVERPAAPVAKRVVQCAEELGVAILTSRQAANGGLSRFAAAVAALPPRSNIVAGLYQERSNPDGSVDWAFIVDRKGRGWILDAICREIGSRQPGSWQVAYHPNPSPNAKNLFFSHYALLLKYYADGKLENLNGSNSFVWYTHPREEDPVTVARLLLALEKVTKVIFACESNRRIWLDRGLPEEKTAVILGAADPTLFRFHERGRGLVGLSSSFYERKNPDCLLELVKRLPHRNFLLLGRKWNQYARFEELRALPNFTYKSAPYRDYPEIYGTFDVFLSMSTLEGGPIPLVEAMMSNAVPVASRTGFAPDLIQHGENGFIFELDAPAEAIAEMIEAAFELPGNIRETVDRYSWDNFSAEVMALAQ